MRPAATRCPTSQLRLHRVCVCMCVCVCVCGVPRGPLTNTRTQRFVRVPGFRVSVCVYVVCVCMLCMLCMLCVCVCVCVCLAMLLGLLMHGTLGC